MKESIQNKLEKLGDRYEELAALLSDPEVIGSRPGFGIIPVSTPNWSRWCRRSPPGVRPRKTWRRPD